MNRQQKKSDIRGSFVPGKEPGSFFIMRKEIVDQDGLPEAVFIWKFLEMGDRVCYRLASIQMGEDTNGLEALLLGLVDCMNPIRVLVDMEMREKRSRVIAPTGKPPSPPRRKKAPATKRSPASGATSSRRPASRRPKSSSG